MATEQKLDLILNELQKTNSHLNGIEDTIGVMKQDIKDLKTEVADIKAEQTTMKQDIADIKAEQTTMKRDIADIKAEQITMKQDIADIKEKQTTMEKNLTALRIIVEQNIQRQIQIIAEGHQSVLRHLAEMQKLYTNYEVLAIEVQVHDYRINEIKRHLSLA